jgi:hypothetical protein
MVFEPALTRTDWFGLIALIVLLAVLVAASVRLTLAARRRSGASLVSVLALSALVFSGVGQLAGDRIRGLCAVEFTPGEAIVRGFGSTVVLPLDGQATVDISGGSIRLVSGERTVVLPSSAQWAADSLVVDAGYLANEFMGRAR